ncbi:homocysteine S-methyltransferase [Gephyromycinifex aptenodytis]|uniref:homocysteine S-methyltransferase n=1 Tax=Gephyromycinifex aptenodytis TaxID=2716227 RepID=UPI001B2FE570|nr:homocysteine S-methyltransferase [Gephyromycinifex aptenodytis]
MTWQIPAGLTISDGGLATQLERQGHDLSGTLWSAALLARDPQAIVAAHRAFLEAGSQVVTTASYQASFTGFSAAGIEEGEATRLMRLSVALARQAAEEHQNTSGQRAAVAASLGPYGAALADGSEYRGRYGLSGWQLRDWHARRLELLVNSGADLLAIETIPDAEEAQEIVGLLAGTGMPAWLAYTIDGEFTRAGQPLEEAFALVQGVEEIKAVGVNCCDPLDVLPAVRRAADSTSRPVVVYPNSGEGWDAAERVWTGSGHSLKQLAPAWVQAGARIIGGCCRVTPEQIRSLSGLGEDPS